MQDFFSIAQIILIVQDTYGLVADGPGYVFVRVNLLGVGRPLRRKFHETVGVGKGEKQGAPV